MTTIAFLGLGNMGAPMAANLVKAGNVVRGFDPVPAARSSAAGDGVTVFEDAVAAVAGADVVVTMLPNGALVRQCYADVMPAGDGSLILHSIAGDVVMHPAGAGHVRVASDQEPVGFALVDAHGGERAGPGLDPVLHGLPVRGHIQQWARKSDIRHLLHHKIA